MDSNDIRIFRGFESTDIDWFAAIIYVYEYQTEPGGGLKPAALASSKVTGNTFTLT
jgi:hypothetical protein